MTLILNLWQFNIHKKPTTVLQPGISTYQNRSYDAGEMKITSIKGSKFKPKTIFWAHVSEM